MKMNIFPNKPFFSNAKIATFLVSTFGFISINSPNPVHAVSLESVNEKLSSYDLPPMLFVPPGFQPVVSEYGRGNSQSAIKNPIIVQFAAPQNWIVEKTNVNANGEAGKIAANDYVRGDSAFMFLYTLQGDEKVDVSAKPLFQKILLKSISQKGDNSEGFRVTKIEAGSPGLNGQTYVVVDFEYKINTEAGFLVSRKGVAAFTSVGPDVQTLVSVTTDKRYKELGEALHDIARTFRVNKLNSGVFAS